MANDVLVDSNVLIDIFGAPGDWTAWSRTQVERLSGRAMLMINPVIFAEISVNLPDFETVDALVPEERFTREDLPWESAFAAAKAHLVYRRRGGTKTSPLPDFFIGAHAQVRGHRLLTRDRLRYETYFPEVDLIAPD